LPAQRIVSYCLAEDFDIGKITMLASRFPASRKIKGAFIIPWEKGEYFVFSYGVVVVWQTDTAEPDLSWLEPAFSRPEPEIEKDYFEYAGGDAFRIHFDRITMDSEEPLCRLAVSHALAQSSKLSVFERRAKNLIGDTQAIAADLARNGRIAMKRRTLSRWQGKAHLSKSDILLRFDLLDTPEFFWDYPEYQHYYQKTIGYLELEQRLHLIQHKLNTVNDVLGLVAEELRHQHSSALEWIIILLIAFEILVFIFHDWLGLI
jgi:uncharacterized Rmd1/YagE family protein